MSGFKMEVLIMAALCSVVTLFAYMLLFHGEALAEFFVCGLMFLLFVAFLLVLVGFAACAVFSVSLSIWWGLEWCWKKVRRKGGRA